MKLVSIMANEAYTVKIYEGSIGPNRFKIEKLADGKVVETVRRFTFTAAQRLAEDMLK